MKQPFTYEMFEKPENSITEFLLHGKTYNAKCLVNRDGCSTLEISTWGPWAVIGYISLDSQTQMISYRIGTSLEWNRRGTVGVKDLIELSQLLEECVDDIRAKYRLTLQQKVSELVDAISYMSGPLKETAGNRYPIKGTTGGLKVDD